MTDQPGDKPKIQIDDDWKAQARAEKEKLAQQEAAAAQDPDAAGAGGPGGMPEADFKTLVSTMVTQALFAMGAIPDPQTGQRMVHIELAKHHIDMLGVVQTKTHGNLDDEEKQMLDESVSELRQNFVQLVEQVRQHQAKQAAGGQPGPGGIGGAGPMPGGGNPGGIIT